jgi:hypothetical protein
MTKLSNSLNIYCDEFKFYSLSPTWITRFPPKNYIIRHFIKFFQSDTEVLTNNQIDFLMQQQLTTLVSWQISRSHNYMTQPVSSSSFNTPLHDSCLATKLLISVHRQVLFYSRDTFLKKCCTNRTQDSHLKVYFLGNQTIDNLIQYNVWLYH